MAEYLLTGRTPEGKKATERVEAASADDAVKTLRDRGYTEIVLHTDDVMAQCAGPGLTNQFITPADHVVMRRLGQWGYMLFVLAKLYRQGWSLNLLAVGFLVFRRVMAYPWGFLDVLAIGWLLMPLVVVLVGQFLGPARKYNELIEQVAWGRWEETLRLLPAIRSKIPPQEAAVREAQALAGLGRLDEGLAVLQPFAGGNRIPEWMYWGLVADVYLTAQQTDRALEAEERAAALAPDNPTVLVGLALTVLRFRRDTARARALLQEAKKHQISDVLAPFLEMTEGILAFEEGHAHQAVERLEKALAAATRFVHASPLVGAMIDRMHTYLALAYAGTRDYAAAQRHFAIAEPRLRALRSDDLLRRCRQVLGQ
ncbi:MAG: hypothetical protein NUV77_00880 [Thermoguttaceae bacterium]|jgi:tetratricopeptide (TPR) repeat protein|nr:hypothetical protein [Thermoguttaceae bacterium]